MGNVNLNNINPKFHNDVDVDAIKRKYWKIYERLALFPESMFKPNDKSVKSILITFLAIKFQVPATYLFNQVITLHNDIMFVFIFILAIILVFLVIIFIVDSGLI